MRRLALDATLRAELGAAARRHWAANHTVAHMAADYEHAIAAAAATPTHPGRALPAHVTEDHTGLARRLAAGVGVAVDFLVADHSTERRSVRSRWAGVGQRVPGPARHRFPPRRRRTQPLVIKKAAYESTVVRDGDEIEIVNFVGGG